MKDYYPLYETVSFPKSLKISVQTPYPRTGQAQVAPAMRAMEQVSRDLSCDSASVPDLAKGEFARLVG